MRDASGKEGTGGTRRQASRAGWRACRAGRQAGQRGMQSRETVTHYTGGHRGDWVRKAEKTLVDDRLKRSPYKV